MHARATGASFGIGSLGPRYSTSNLMFAHEPALNYYAERVAEPEPDLIDRSPKVVRTLLYVRVRPQRESHGVLGSMLT